MDDKVQKVHTIRADVRLNSNDTEIWLDREPLKGCTGFKLESDVESYPLVTLTMRAEVVLDVETSNLVIERPESGADDE